MDRFFSFCREINRFSDSKIGPELAKPTISLALLYRRFTELLARKEPEETVDQFFLFLHTDIICTSLVTNTSARSHTIHFHEESNNYHQNP